MSYKLGSLFDGSGGFPLAGSLCGIEPVWASEVEPYPIAVTKSRFPKMKHLGDISKINGADIEPVDIITFGSPCQDLSVAGKRAGLKHEANGDEETTRSGLFMEAVRIIKEMREKTNGILPRFAIWENVPGAFSSNRGEDFRIVLEELIKVIEPSAVMPGVPPKGWAYADTYRGDGWSIAYRVLDAQYWGVPQRRRRIYLVADFRGECAKEILFEREGLRGYFTQGRTPWKDTPADAQGSTRADDREGEGAVTLEPGIAAREGGHIYEGVSGTLRANAGDNQMAVAYGVDAYNQALTGDKAKTINAIASDADHIPCAIYSVENHPADSRVNLDESGKVQTLTSRMGTGGGNVPMVMEPEEPVICLQGNGIDRADTAGCNGKGYREDKSYTLNTIDRPAVAYGVTTKGNGDAFISEERHTALSGGGGQAGQGYPCTVYGLDRASFNQGQNAQFDFTVTEESQLTLTARGPGAVAQPILHASKASFFMRAAEGAVDTLVATDYKDPQMVVYPAPEDVHKFVEENNADAPHQQDLLQTTDGVARTIACGTHASGSHLTKTVINHGTHYIVRRLTPTECARLQGFADRWGVIEAKTFLTDAEYNFWLEVRKTYDAINGRAEKNYTKPQILTWYNKLHTDSAEYKMWGNGIALPTALYVLQGVAEALSWAEFME